MIFADAWPIAAANVGRRPMTASEAKEICRLKAEELNVPWSSEAGATPIGVVIHLEWDPR